MKVLKFGGTSVGSPERMNDVAKIILKDQDKKIVVLSAVSGTTNSLVGICDAKKESASKGDELIATLEEKYYPFVATLLKDEKGLASANTLIKEKFELLRNTGRDNFSDKDERFILAQGELISTNLFQLYCEENGINSALIPALDFMSTKEGEPELDEISVKISKILAGRNEDVFITQGYICMNEFDEVDNLKRGGSDYTASIVGAAIQGTEVQIWTDIDGMHNNDPRVVDQTRPIQELSFDEAAELAYFGAKILHPASILPAQKKSVPVKLLNTMDPSAKGTVISSKTTDGQVKAVAAKDGITAIKIKSGRMLLAYGFLRKVFEVFEKFKTPIDMITTSEVAVSLTIDDTSSLESILAELEVFGNVEVTSDQAIVCVVGNMSFDNTGRASTILDCFNDIPVRMISYGGSRSNISVLIPQEYKKAALISLNKGLFKFS